MRIYDLIVKKRDNHELTTEEIQFFVNEYTKGNIEDYQASALLMAIFLNKCSKRETVDLTYAMMNSGDTIDLSGIEGIKVDKHSTGGVGDTTTLVLAPLVASCGVPVAKMSGRGLGHTGGTLDKLEAIEGFSINVSIDDFIDHVNKHKVAVIGQTKNIAPADKKLYALRDVTGTVDNLSLIAASIMSKKLAAGSDAIVLDVKVGSGAFMKDMDQAIELAKEMVAIGNMMNRETMGVITNMDQPLGFAIGNALEVQEAIETLQNKGPADLEELCITLGGKMIMLGGITNDFEEAKKIIKSKLVSGEAFEKFKEFVASQEGNPAVADNFDLLPKAKHIVKIESPTDGFVSAIKSDDIGIAAMILGAGRESKDSKIDLASGIMLKKKIGDAVRKGETIAVMYTNWVDKLEQAQERFLNNFHISSEAVAADKLIKAIVTVDGVKYL